VVLRDACHRRDVVNRERLSLGGCRRIAGLAEGCEIALLLSSSSFSVVAWGPLVRTIHRRKVIEKGKAKAGRQKRLIRRSPDTCISACLRSQQYDSTYPPEKVAPKSRDNSIDAFQNARKYFCIVLFTRRLRWDLVAGEAPAKVRIDRYA